MEAPALALALALGALPRRRFRHRSAAADRDRRHLRWSASSRLFANVIAPHNPFDLATLELSADVAAGVDAGRHDQPPAGTDEQG